MELRQLRTMVAIAEAGSFAAAGDRVGLSQSAVSLQVKALEDDLGVALFDRGHRPPKATPAGEALIRHARAVLAETDDLRRALRGGGIAGSLRLGVVPTAFSGLLPPTLAALRDFHPDLRVEVRSGNSAGLAGAVSSGELDAGLVTEPPAAIPGLVWNEIAREPLVVVAPRDAAGVTDDDLLTGHPFIWFNRNTWAGQQIERQLRVRALEVDAQIEIDHLDAITRLVEAGLGVSIVPVCAGAPPFPPSLRTIPFRADPAHRVVGMLAAAHGRKAALIGVLLDILQSVR